MRDIPLLKAEFFKTLGHPLRIRVLELLIDDEKSVAELLEAIDAEQSHLSQQLGILRRAGFVEARRQGTSVIYSLSDDRVAELLSTSRQMLLDMLTASRDELQVQ